MKRPAIPATPAVPPVDLPDTDLPDTQDPQDQDLPPPLPVQAQADVHARAHSSVATRATFGEFDVDWRSDLVSGWNPLQNGRLALPEAPGLGIELDEGAIAEHPYRPLAFPSLWDASWRDEFTGTAKLARIK